MPAGSPPAEGSLSSPALGSSSPGEAVFFLARGACALGFPDARGPARPFLERPGRFFEAERKTRKSGGGGGRARYSNHVTASLFFPLSFPCDASPSRHPVSGQVRLTSGAIFEGRLRRHYELGQRRSWAGISSEAQFMPVSKDSGAVPETKVAASGSLAAKGPLSNGEAPPTYTPPFAFKH